MTSGGNSTSLPHQIPSGACSTQQWGGLPQPGINTELLQRRCNRSPPKCLCIIIKGHFGHGCPKPLTPTYPDAVSPANSGKNAYGNQAQLCTYTTPSSSNLLNLLIHVVRKPHENFVWVPFPRSVFKHSGEGNCWEGTQKNHELACPFPHRHKRMERGPALKLQVRLSSTTLSLTTEMQLKWGNILLQRQDRWYNQVPHLP